MKRTHAVVIALTLGVAAVLGLFALNRTTHLAAGVRSANQAQIIQRRHRLAAGERTLRQALAKVKVSPAPTAAAPRTVYVRPAPIVVSAHHSGGEAEGEQDD